MCSAPSLGGSSSDSEREPEEADRAENQALNDSEDTGTNSSTDSSSHEEEDTGAVSKSEENVALIIIWVFTIRVALISFPKCCCCFFLLVRQTHN